MQINKEFILRVATIICIVATLLYVVISSQKANVLSNDINPRFKQINSTIFMEAFGFFTKSPKHDETFAIYSVTEDEATKLNLRNNSTYNLFGISRKNRVRLVEIGKVVQSVGTDDWSSADSKTFEKSLLKNADTLHYKGIEVEVKALEYDKYIITKSKPIPWEWNKIKKSSNLKYVAVNITNDH